MKKIFKDSREFKKNEEFCAKMQSLSLFLDITKFPDFRWKTLMSAEIRGCVTWFLYLFDLLWVRYKCTNLHHCRICVTDVREWGLFWPPICEQPRKCPSLIGLTLNIFHTSLMLLFILWKGKCWLKVRHELFVKVIQWC